MKQPVIGTAVQKEVTVTPQNTAKALLSGALDVYATPSMIAMMECAAAECAAQFHDPEDTTVGTMVNIRHVAATPLGMKVTAEAKLIEADGRKMLFEVKAWDEAGVIGEGTHERFVVTADRFLAKANARGK